MKDLHAQSRRGVALLVALVALATLSTLAVGALQRAVNGSTEAELLLRSRHAGLLVEDLTPVLLEWAAVDGGSVIVASEDPAAWTPVFQSGSGAMNVEIDAIDCNGRLHVDRIDTFARLGLPAEFQQLNRPIAPQIKFKDAPKIQPLLETIASRLPSEMKNSAFPVLTNSGDRAEQTCLAEWITTHGNGDLNVNTAPIPLLQAGLRGLAPESARSILDLRRAGEPVPAALIQTSDHGPNDSVKHVRLTTSSSAIGFILTVTQHSSRQRWWIVAERLSPTPRQEVVGESYGADLAKIGSWRITERRKIER